MYSTTIIYCGIKTEDHLLPSNRLNENQNGETQPVKSKSPTPLIAGGLFFVYIPRGTKYLGNTRIQGNSVSSSSDSSSNSHVTGSGSAAQDAVAGKGSLLLERVRAKLGSALIDATLSLGDVVIGVERKHVLDVVKILKLDSELRFNLLSSVTAVDWMDRRATRFEVVYHFVSLAHGFILRMKVPVPEEDPSVESVVGLYGGANFMERECWDMVGITFKGHPDLRRVLMYDEFKGHPLRKDYPVQGKQPRVRLISPEVSNTARDMNRPLLYSINKRAV